MARRKPTAIADYFHIMPGSLIVDRDGNRYRARGYEAGWQWATHSGQSTRKLLVQKERHDDVRSVACTSYEITVVQTVAPRTRTRAADFIDAYYDRGVWSVPADDMPDMPPPSGAPLQPVRMVQP